MSDPNVTQGHRSLRETLSEVVETLAPLDRTPCSPGEREAALWLAERLGAVAGVEVALEDEPSWGTFPPTATGLGMLGIFAAGLVLRRHRAAGALLAAAGLACIIDEAQNGPRLLRRLVRRRRRTVNLIARIQPQGVPGQPNDPDQPNDPARPDDPARTNDSARTNGAGRAGGAIPAGTLVVLAHHDAPQTGFLFDQTLQRKLYEAAPQLIESVKTPLPQWWIGLAGPLLTITAALTRRAGPARAAIAVGAFGTAIVADVWRNATVPGANDNLSGVAALVGLAELLRDEPVADMRVLLVSCGAEETLQDGVRAFIASHRHELTPGQTWFVNLDTVGSPHLVMLEGEGPIWMESYNGPWLRDLLAKRAAALGIELHRGFRARASTDSVIPSRAGYPIATLVSMTAWRSPANYHLPSDVPANLDYNTVGQATRLVHDLVGRLGERARSGVQGAA